MSPTEAFYNGKHVFITGATGFVGKAVVEKLLRSIPNIERIYLLVRASKGLSAKQRVDKEIIGSPIFNSLKSILSEQQRSNDFEHLVSKLVPIQGDMTSPKLGISVEDSRMLEQSVDVVIHCAASVDFDDPLDRALQLNTLGALELFNLAACWSKVKSFVHVSTAYVGANQHHGRVIKEEVHPLEFDPMDIIKKVKNNEKGEIATEQLRLQIMGAFPNTYTLTKSMTETLLQRVHKKIPLAIVRPSIIGSAWREPCPGWIDVISAASAVFLTSGLGIVTMLPGNPMGVADIIPVDHVVNQILRAGVEIYGKELEKPFVSHSSTSTLNPLRWRVCASSVLNAFNDNHVPSSKLTPGPVKFKMIQNQEQFAFEWALKYSLPVRAYDVFARIRQSEYHTKQKDQLKMLVNKAQDLIRLFTPFTTQEYFFGGDVMRRYIEDDDPKFSVDVSDLSWPLYFSNFAYGINRFILHEDLVPVSDTAVTHNNMNLTHERLLKWDSDHHGISFPGLIPDISWAYTSSRAPGYTKQGIFGRLMGMTGWREGLAHEAEHVPRSTIRPTRETLRLVIESKKVQSTIRKVAAEKKVSPQNVQKDAVRMLRGFASTMEDAPPRRFAWALRKVWRKLYNGIRVHEQGLERVRNVIANADVPVVLLPTHRSYVDFLVISYIFFAYNLPTPFIASDEGFAKMNGISGLLRSSGAFFLKRGGQFKNDELYNALFTEYMHRLLEDCQMIEFFIEGSRSRSGKSLDPKSGLLSICLEPVLSGRVKDVLLVPIAIDYEKPLEVTLYSDEMLGTNKRKESTTNLLKAAMALNSKFGNVSIQFERPVSIKEYLEQSKLIASPTPDMTLADLSRPLGFQMISALNNASLCMTTHLVATLVLINRHGISFDQLVPAVDWLRAEIRVRGGEVVCVEGMHRETLVQKALSLLAPLIQERSGHRIFEVAVNTFPKDYKNMIALGYYRNKLIHLFAEEAIWACSLCAQGKVWSQRGNVDSRNVEQMQPNNFHVVSDHGMSSLKVQANGDAKHTVSGSSSNSGRGLASGFSYVMKLPFDRSKADQVGHEGVDHAHPSIPAPTDLCAPLCILLDDVTFLSTLLKREFVGMKSLNPDLEEQEAAFLDTLEIMSRRKILSMSSQSNEGETNEVKVESLFSQYDDVKNNTIYLNANASSERSFTFLCSIIWPFVDSYFVAASSLQALQLESKITVQNLIRRMALLAETLYHDRVLKHYESCSVGVLTNAIETFKEWGVIKVESKLLPKKPNVKPQTEDVVSLLPPFNSRTVLREFVQKIDRYRSPVSSSEGFGKTAVSDVPFLARL